MTKWDNTFNQYQDTPDAKSVQLLVKHFGSLRDLCGFGRGGASAGTPDVVVAT
jgi:hypothetical protein